MNIVIKKAGIVLFFLCACMEIWGQIAEYQIINPKGGASSKLDDGLKILLDTVGSLSVYRENQAQYFYRQEYTWKDKPVKDKNYSSIGAVKLRFRFSQDTAYKKEEPAFIVCSTTSAQQHGNDWTASISGTVKSPISTKDFYVTINLYYTHPNKYFIVDYYVIAPQELPKGAETLHLYLSHDAYILGSDASRAYLKNDGTGEFVGNFRDSNDLANCKQSTDTTYRYPSHHGFKSTKFRSYYTGDFDQYGTRFYHERINIADNKIGTNPNQHYNCVDDAIAVELEFSSLKAGTVGARRVYHCYGDIKGEFDNIQVKDPTVLSGTNKAVTIAFTSAAYSENEGHDTHKSNAIKLKVWGGNLLQDMVCNFDVKAESNISDSHYSYAKGVVIPAGNYSSQQEITLDNITIVGDKNCNSNRKLKISIDESGSGSCSDLIKVDGISTTILTIVDDDQLTSGTIATAKTKVCYDSAPDKLTESVAPTGGDPTKYTYQWEYSTNGTNWYPASPAQTGKEWSSSLPKITVKTRFRRKVMSGDCEAKYSNILEIDASSAFDAGSIRSSTSFICSGQTVYLSNNLAPSGGMGDYTYQWQYSTNGTNWYTVTGITTADYTTTALSTTTYFKRKVTDSCGGTKENNTITITVYSDLQAGTIGYGNAKSQEAKVCYNGTLNNLTESVAPSGGDGNVTYKWQYSTNSGITWNLLSASGQTISQSPLPSITQETWYRREISGCKTVYSNIVKLTVYPDLTAGAIAYDNKSTAKVCYNEQLNNLKESVAPSGGDGNVTYKWLYSTDKGNSWNELIISGQTVKESPLPAITQETWYRRYLKSCTKEAYSDPVKIEVYAEFNAGSIRSSSATVCSGQTVKLDELVAPSGGTGNYLYLWEYRETGSSAWTQGATTRDFTPSSLTKDMDFRRKIVDSCGGITESNIVTVRVGGNSTAIVSIAVLPDVEVCENTELTLKATPTNGGTTPAYVWTIDGKQIGGNNAECKFTPTWKNRKSKVKCVMTSSDSCVSNKTVTDEKQLRISSCSLPVNPHQRGRLH